jgi:hypothetical protein
MGCDHQEVVERGNRQQQADSGAAETQCTKGSWAGTLRRDGEAGSKS